MRIGGTLTVRTLADVRLLLGRKLPKAYRDRPHWQAAARDLAAGDVEETVISLQFAFLVEGIACRPVTGS